MQRRDFLSLTTTATMAMVAAGVAGCAAPMADAVAPARLQAAATGRIAALGPLTALRRIAFGSCIDQTQPQPQPIWDTVLADAPDLFIFGGDNVYASTPPWSIAQLDQAYAEAGRVPGLAGLRQTVPHLAIWDDHDYGLNDGGAEFVHKQASKDAFMDFWQIGADDPRRARGGLYHAEVIGPPGRRVQVILLDTRWFRSPLKATDRRGAPGRERYVPDLDPSKTMLGEAQWLWLDTQLRLPADLRLVVSSIQLVVDGHGWERWGNLPAERDRFYRLLASTRAGGVVILSGDRHTGALYRATTGTPYPLYEMTSSGITHPWKNASEAGPNRLGELYTGLHYGCVDIDWAALSVRLQLKDARGQTQRSQLVPFNEMK